jgi:hypothetical protein
MNQSNKELYRIKCFCYYPNLGGIQMSESQIKALFRAEERRLTETVGKPVRVEEITFLPNGTKKAKGRIIGYVPPTATVPTLS